MKKRLLAVILSVAMVSSLVACGSTSTNDTSSSSSETTEASSEASTEATEELTPQKGGQLIWGSSTQLSGDWGREMWTNNAADRVVRELMDGYFTVVTNEGGEYVLNETVVADYQSEMNEDGTKTYTVKINEGLVYNNGDPITAKDFVVQDLFSTTKVATDLGATVSGDLTFVGGKEYKSGDAAYCSGIRLIDDYTFSYTIVADKIPYFYDMKYIRTFPMSLTYWFGEEVDVVDDGEGCYFTGDFTAEAVSSTVEAARFATSDRVTAGPYNLVEFDASSLQATLEINPNFIGDFQGQTPYIEKLIITKTETETWADALRTGAVDFCDTLTDGDEVNTALDIVDGGGFDYVQFTRAGYGKIMFQCDFGPTQFEAVRHAVAMLLDRNDFANTFCQGWGSVVSGPYGLGLWQYQEAEEYLADNLNTYDYSYDRAVEVLVADGWVLDATGAEWTSGTRYKEVTAEEAGSYAHNVTLADGRILMPLIIEWSSSEGNPVSDLLSVMLAQNPDVTSAGMTINQNIMTFSELLNYMYRDASQGDQYGVPTYGMYNLASNFTPGSYDYSYNWTSDPELVALGYNINFLFDNELDQLSMNMVYGLESTDTEGYMDVWKNYIVRWNQLLPEIPLYSNVYVSAFNDKLKGFKQDSFWNFQYGILYAWIQE